MQIEITKYVPQIEIIEAELPYYYKHDLNLDNYGESVIYGKIDDIQCTSIQETNDYNGKEKYEIEKEKYHSIKYSGLNSYFGEKYKSNKEEFEAAKERCLLFLNAC